MAEAETTTTMSRQTHSNPALHGHDSRACLQHAHDQRLSNLFGKDGKPLGDAEGEPDSPVAPLQIKVRGDDFPNAIPNQLFVEWIDGDGDIHILASGETVAADQWYHIAFTLSATDAELWVAGETGDYVLKDAISGDDFAGSLVPEKSRSSNRHPSPWAAACSITA